MYSSNGKNFYMGNDEFYLKFSSINSQDMTRIDKYTTSSVEEELNRMIKLDKDANLLSSESFSSLLENLLKKMDKKLKKLLAKELAKAGINAKSIDLTASPEEILQQIMENPKGEEVLNNIQKQLGQEQKGHRDSNQEVNVENNLDVPNIQTQDDTATFAAIAKPTKLDQQTLASNLFNNANFEEDIIAIVQEIAQNVDRQYASDTFRKGIRY